jgi:capsular polysaccharide biosynthesis protein
VLANDRREVDALEIGRSPWTTARVVPIVGASEAETHAGLAALSEVGLVVDTRRSAGDVQESAFARHVFHLDPRGVWVALRPGRRATTPEPLVELAHEFEGPDPRRRLPKAWHDHAAAVGYVSVTPRLVVIGKRRRHLLRLRDGEALALLPSREPGLGVTEIARLEGGLLDNRGLATEYGGAPDPLVPELLPYPPLVVRRYDGPVHSPRAHFFHHGRSALPESFRWHLTPQPEAHGLVNVDQHFGLLKKKEVGPTLEGSYFPFLYNNPGHFGHLMTEALSKLWGWGPAKAADPSLKLLCRFHPSREQTVERRLESTLLPALGISAEDIVFVDGPVTVTSMVGCTPMWHNAPPFYVHPAILETWGRLRTGLIATAPAPVAPKIFVTRRDGKRLCTNFAEVEAIFAAHGFDIVTPETLSIPEQVAMFAGARVVAGFGGAGMFNLAYADAVETVIVLNQWAYHARNEQLFAAAHGAHFHCFWNPPAKDHPAGEFSYRAHQSRWTFDVERNGEQLRDVLEGLVE